MSGAVDELFDFFPTRRPGKIATSKFDSNRTLWVDESEVEFGEWHGHVIHGPGSCTPGLRSAVCRGKPYTHIFGLNPVSIGGPGSYGHDIMVGQAVQLLTHACVTKRWVEAVMPIVIASPHVKDATKLLLAMRFSEGRS